MWPVFIFSKRIYIYIYVKWRNLNQMMIYIYIYIYIKAAGDCSMVRFKEECPPHRIDCPLRRKPGGSTRSEEKSLLDTACRLRGKVLDMPCDSYWGWLLWFYRTLSHFVSFKNRNHWPQFESCLKSSSGHGAKARKFSAWRKYTRNHLSRVIT